MPKITLLGAGSGFTRPLFTDILLIKGIKRGTIGLVDIDAKRLQVNVRLIKRILQMLGKEKQWKLEASTDRRKILKGTDYLISTIEVAGVKCVRADNDIPLKYGIDQCIGDTMGPGGIMKSLRTLPGLLALIADAKKYCPKALIMNYTNPMSVMTLGALRSSDMPFIGLCHGVQATSREIAKLLDIKYNDLIWECGGINHMAWFTRVSHKGKDLIPAIQALADDPVALKREPIRLDMAKHFGYFSTETSGHSSEYVPYYRKRKDLIKKHCGKRYNGESSFYANNWPRWRKECDKQRREQANGKQEIKLTRSVEYAAEIIEGHFLGQRRVINASVANTGLIPNLPQTGVVEVPVVVDQHGFTPTYFGPLPEQCAALCRSNMALFELTVDGILRGDREAIIHAMMLDPLSAAVCSPGEIRSMAEELFKAEKNYIPKWTAAKRKAKAVKKKASKKRA